MSNPFGDDDDDGSNPFFETSKSSVNTLSFDFFFF